jgi:hypothetical protein
VSHHATYTEYDVSVPKHPTPPYFAAKAELDPFFIHLLLRKLIIKGFTMLMTISSLVSSSVDTLQRAAQNVKDLISVGTGAIYNALQTLFSHHQPTPSRPVNLTEHAILIPLHGYHQKLSITAPSSLPGYDTHVASLPAELIEMIQGFCSNEDLLSLTSVNQAALASRFCNPRLQKLSFNTIKDTKQFLAYCQAGQDRQAQALMVEKKPKIRTWLTSALSPHTTTRFISLNQEYLQAVKALTLTLSDPFTAEEYDLLFSFLPELQQLTVYFEGDNPTDLGSLLKATQHLNLHDLAIVQPRYTSYGFPRNTSYSESSVKVEDHLPDELWQLTTLKTLIISGFRNIYSISEDIGRLTELKSLTLEDMGSLKTLPVSLEQLDKLEALTLRELYNITALPEEMGQLKALKSLTLWDIHKLEALPASFGQLDKLEALTLRELYNITALPEEMGQLKALKSLTLREIHKLEALPASFGQLHKLEALTLRHLNITALPEEMGQFKSLKSLEISYSPKLKALAEGFLQLDKLETIIFL